jgi:peptidoglycan L-alanyl-D-glutamate endopeptidase CwlK
MEVFMPFSFSTQSKTRLVGVHPKLVAVVHRALEVSKVDFMVAEGVRTPERQKHLYAQGRTAPGNKVTWTLNSNHFKNPRTGYGHAVDLLPAPYDWKELKHFDTMALAMLQAADELHTPIRWGADWDRDGKPRERGETDSPHFELWNC